MNSTERILKSNMKQYTPLLLIGLALLTVLVSIYGSGGYSQVIGLQEAASLQKERNQLLESKVEELHKKVRGLRTDDRYLEKTARSELGMAKPGELIVIFDKNR